jgi:hypothetical protein
MKQVRAEAGLSVEAMGADRTGMIKVWVGADGLPDRAEVGAGWRGRLGPAEFAEAVMQAGRAAVAAQLRQVKESRQPSESEVQSWTKRMDRARTASADRRDPQTPLVPPAAVFGAAEGSGPGGATPAGSALPGWGADGQTRDLGALAEDVFALLRRRRLAEADSGPAGRWGTGEAGQGQLSVAVSTHGELTCRASASWVDRQAPAALGSAVTQALAGARAELQGAGLRREADGLFADLIGLLQRPERLLSGDHPARQPTRKEP